MTSRLLLHPLWLVVLGLPYTVACGGMTAYNPDASTGDDTNTDTHTGDSGDTHETQDTGDTHDTLDPLSVSSVSPDYGTNGGGTEVTIKGGPFDNSAHVWFGNKEADVGIVSQNQLTVTVPKSTQEGAVDVKVVTDTRSGTATSAFTYWADGTGKYGAMGMLQWYHVNGGYWGGSKPADFGSADFYFIDPVADAPWKVLFSSAKNQCKSEYAYSGSVNALDIGATQIKWTIPSTGATLQLSPDPDYTWYYASADTDGDGYPDLPASQFKQDGIYKLQEVKASGFPAISSDDIAETPGSFTVTSPDIGNSSTPPTIAKAISFKWSTAGAGSYVILEARRVNSAGTAYAETVTCVVDDNGSFNMPSSVWSGWASGVQIDLFVGRAVEGSGILPHNNAKSGVMGVYWNYGAGFTQ